MAGLPGSRASVWVVPLLSASVPSCALSGRAAVPVRLAAPVGMRAAGRMPIRLLLAVTSVLLVMFRSRKSRLGPPRLPATMVLVRVTGTPVVVRAMPPAPVVDVLVPLFPEMVLFEIVSGVAVEPALMQIAPPRPAELL